MSIKGTFLSVSVVTSRKVDRKLSLINILNPYLFSPFISFLNLFQKIYCHLLIYFHFILSIYVIGIKKIVFKNVKKIKIKLF